MKKKLIAGISLLVGVSLAINAIAESDPRDTRVLIAQVKPDQPRSSATVSPSAIAELRRNLRSSDENVQISAMQTALNSDVRAVREIAFDEGFSSDRPVLRAMALHGRISDSAVLIVEVAKPPNTAADKWKSVVSRIGGEKWSFFIDKVDPANGAITFRKPGAPGPGTGRIAGQTLTLATHYVQVTLSLEGNREMVGSASYIHFGTFPARLKLQ